MSNAFSTSEVKVPEVKFNKNGYEIRTEILKEAKDLVAQEFSFKWQGWEQSVERDEKTGQIVTKVAMPEFPGLDKVLETAEKMYAFVNQGATKK
jgi:hypothetical protein